MASSHPFLHLIALTISQDVSGGELFQFPLLTLLSPADRRRGVTSFDGQFTFSNPNLALRLIAEQRFRLCSSWDHFEEKKTLTIIPSYDIIIITLDPDPSLVFSCPCKNSKNKT